MLKHLRQILGAVLRPALVLLIVFLVIGSAGLVYQGVRTIQQLRVVESDRDQWQRPDDVIRMLDLKSGSTVVDFGSGSGYFALKLSETVGPAGSVLAVDLRKLSLFFLRARALLRWKGNIRTIVGAPVDPHLSEGTADAILIANTYHELTDPRPILRHLSQSLRSGGRIVIVDPDSISGEAEHHASAHAVESDLHESGFQVVTRDDHFIAQTDQVWWLIVAVKTDLKP